jgi:hypothetical protein
MMMIVYLVMPTIKQMRFTCIQCLNRVNVAIYSHKDSVFLCGKQSHIFELIQMELKTVKAEHRCNKDIIIFYPNASGILSTPSEIPH